MNEQFKVKRGERYRSRSGRTCVVTYAVRLYGVVVVRYEHDDAVSDGYKCEMLQSRFIANWTLLDA
jgi:hypothetical protein